MSGVKKWLRSCADVSNQVFLHRNESRTVNMNYYASVVAHTVYKPTGIIMNQFNGS